MKNNVDDQHLFALTRFARSAACKPAAINGTTGETLTYEQLDTRSDRFARYMHQAGLRSGDHIAVLMENNLRFFEVVWAALRSGLLVTPINRYSTPSEAAYIVENSDAKLVVSSFAVREVAAKITEQVSQCHLLMVDGCVEGWESYDDVVFFGELGSVSDQRLGAVMLYSSGTTGRPKGILRALPDIRASEGPPLDWRKAAQRYDFTHDTVFFTGAPLYHGAPCLYSMNVQFHGGTVVFTEKFDPTCTLALIERYRISHSFLVPTMFVRMLKLTDEERKAYDLSSHRTAIHAGGPCAEGIKRQMIGWWGPILEEFYGGSEGCGNTAISSPEWLMRPGSVGRTVLGTVRICNAGGDPLPPRQEGIVYFERENRPFEYYKDEEKTRSAQHPVYENWMTIGDIGYLDEDDYLFLTDRLAYTIISGGVNIYPRVIEDSLILHPDVADVAVIGVPNEEMGEEVKAIVELEDGVSPSEQLAEELIQFTRDKISRFMVPKSVEFTSQLPRSQYGKMDKKSLSSMYWNKSEIKQ